MPIPMPPNVSWRSTAADAPTAPRGELPTPRRGDFPTPPRRAGPCLTAAVAAIVAVAAQRARTAGTLDALREAVAAALDSADQTPPTSRADGRGGPQRGAAPEAASDAARLRALLGRATPL